MRKRALETYSNMGDVRGDNPDDGSEFFAMHREPLPFGWSEIDLASQNAEDRADAANNASVDKAIAAIKRGAKTLPPSQFGAVVKLMFDGFPRERRAALDSGTITLGDGKVVRRGAERQQPEAA